MLALVSQGFRLWRGWLHHSSPLPVPALLHHPDCSWRARLHQATSGRHLLSEEGGFLPSFAGEVLGRSSGGPWLSAARRAALQPPCRLCFVSEEPDAGHGGRRGPGRERKAQMLVKEIWRGGDQEACSGPQDALVA